MPSWHMHACTHTETHAYRVHTETHLTQSHTFMHEHIQRNTLIYGHAHTHAETHAEKYMHTHSHFHRNTITL